MADDGYALSALRVTGFIMQTIPEQDWKRLRLLKDEMLALACEHVFQQAERIAANREGKEHQAYLDLWDLLQTKNQEIAMMFDDLKRSNAVYKLAAWKHNGLITEKQLEQFTPKTMQAIEIIDA